MLVLEGRELLLVCIIFPVTDRPIINVECPLLAESGPVRDPYIERLACQILSILNVSKIPKPVKSAISRSRAVFAK